MGLQGCWDAGQPVACSLELLHPSWGMMICHTSLSGHAEMKHEWKKKASKMYVFWPWWLTRLYFESSPKGICNPGLTSISWSCITQRWYNIMGLLTIFWPWKEVRVKRWFESTHPTWQMRFLINQPRLCHPWPHQAVPWYRRAINPRHRVATCPSLEPHPGRSASLCASAISWAVPCLETSSSMPSKKNSWRSELCSHLLAQICSPSDAGWAHCTWL